MVQDARNVMAAVLQKGVKIERQYPRAELGCDRFPRHGFGKKTHRRQFTKALWLGQGVIAQIAAQAEQALRPVCVQILCRIGARQQGGKIGLRIEMKIERACFGP